MAKANMPVMVPAFGLDSAMMTVVTNKTIAAALDMRIPCTFQKDLNERLFLGIRFGFI
jgi:hypothetical protein